MDLIPDCDKDCVYYKELVLIASISISILILLLFCLCTRICAELKKFSGRRKYYSRDIKDGNGHRDNVSEDTRETKHEQNEEYNYVDETQENDYEEGYKIKKISNRSANDSFVPKIPKGFPNLGNTCYMNAILQNLVWTPSVHRCLEKHDLNKHDSAETALFKLVEEVRSKNGVTVDRNVLQDVLNAARKHNTQFNGHCQQDSFEMYNTLVGGIQDERLKCKPKTDENSQDLKHTMDICPLTRLFGGVFMTIYQYQSCGHVELTFQMFTSICVPVPKETKGQMDENKYLKETVTDSSKHEEQMRAKLKLCAENEMSKVQSKRKSNHSENLEIASEEVEQNVKQKIDEDQEQTTIPSSGKETYTSSNMKNTNQEKQNTVTENGGQSENKQDVGDDPWPRDESQKTEKKISLEKDLENEGLHAEKQKCEMHSEVKLDHLEEDPSKEKQQIAKQEGHQKQNEPLSVIVISSSGKMEENTRRLSESSETNPQSGEKQNTKTNINNSLDIGQQIDENQNIDVNGSQDTENKANDSPNESGDLTALKKEDKNCFKPLQEATTDKPFTGIELGLNEFTGMEEFPDGIFSCKTCIAEDPAYDPFGETTLKRLFVITPPPVLVLQINRYMQEWTGLTKIDDKVSFPEIFNFSPYCSTAYKVQEQSPRNTNTAILYNLYGAVAHNGTLSGGHYVAYVKTAGRDQKQFSELFFKNGRSKDLDSKYVDEILDFFKNEGKLDKVHNQANGKSEPSTDNKSRDDEIKPVWYYISDSDVRKCNKREVLSISDAYILFYERIV